MLERVVTTRSSRDESSTFYCLRHPSVLLPVSVSTLDFHFRQYLRLDFHKVESSVLIDDPSRCGCIGHGWRSERGKIEGGLGKAGRRLPKAPLNFLLLTLITLMTESLERQRLLSLSSSILDLAILNLSQKERSPAA